MIFDRDAREKMAAADKSWPWKFALRILVVICSLCAIGCVAGAFASRDVYGDSNYDPSTGIIWGLIPLSLAIIWAAISLPVLIFRKKPVHPGFNVAFDLILWLALGVFGGTVTALSASSGFDNYSDAYYYSPDGSSYIYPGSIGSSSSTIDGQDGGQSTGYSDAASSNPQLSYIYTSASGATTTRQPGSADYPCPAFGSCAARNAFINAMMRISRLYAAGAIFVDVVAVLLFVLFVWACIDTHIYNHSRVYDDRARKLADDMITNMRARGELPPVGQAQPLLSSAPVPPGNLAQTSTAYHGRAMSAHSNDPVARGPLTPDIEPAYSNAPHALSHQNPQQPQSQLGRGNSGYQPVTLEDPDRISSEQAPHPNPKITFDRYT